MGYKVQVSSRECKAKTHLLDLAGAGDDSKSKQPVNTRRNQRTKMRTEYEKSSALLCSRNTYQ